MWLINRQMPSKENNKTHNHGFSYVRVFKIINLIIAIIIGFGTFIFLNNLTEGLIPIIGAAIVAFISYWILTLPIKLFENVAIIAKNTTDINNKLSQTNRGESL